MLQELRYEKVPVPGGVRIEVPYGRMARSSLAKRLFIQNERLDIFTRFEATNEIWPHFFSIFELEAKDFLDERNENHKTIDDGGNGGSAQDRQNFRRMMVVGLDFSTRPA